MPLSSLGGGTAIQNKCGKKCGTKCRLRYLCKIRWGGRLFWYLLRFPFNAYFCTPSVSGVLIPLSQSLSQNGHCSFLSKFQKTNWSALERQKRFELSNPTHMSRGAPLPGAKKICNFSFSFNWLRDVRVPNEVFEHVLFTDRGTCLAGHCSDMRADEEMWVRAIALTEL